MATQRSGAFQIIFKDLAVTFPTSQGTKASLGPLQATTLASHHLHQGVYSASVVFCVKTQLSRTGNTLILCHGSYFKGLGEFNWFGRLINFKVAPAD